MSAPGIPVDPIQALARQPVTAPAPPPMPQDDPVALLAAGKLQTAPQGPEPAAAPAAAPPAQHSLDWKGPEWANPAGSLSAMTRNFVNGMTMNIADPVAAATGALFPIKGWTSTKPTYAERYHELLDISRGATAQGQKSHPIESLGASVAGGFFNPVAQGMGVPSSLLEGVGQGAALGGLYSLGGNIGSGKTAPQVAKEAGVSSLIGGGTGAAAYGLGKLLSGATRTDEAQLLHDEGVPLTVGQAKGGGAKRVEDALTSTPVVGDMIRNRQSDALTGFNKAAYNRTLEPLGVKFPDNVNVGNEGIKEVGDTIGKAYDQAFSGAHITKTPQFDGDIQNAVANAANTLPKSRVNIIQDNVDRLITNKFGTNGVLSPDDLKYAKNWFAEQSRAGPNASMDERAIAGAYGDVVDALKSAVGDVDPARQDLIRAADTAYSRFVPLSNAAASNAASGHKGIFTAAQLGQALRGADQSVRHLKFAKGEVPMQDLVQAGQAVLPSSVPDSGTPLRGVIQAAPWMIAGLATEPGYAAAAGAGYGTTAGLYTAPGQKLANALLFGGPTRQAAGQLPWYAVPGALAAISASSAGSKP